MIKPNYLQNLIDSDRAHEHFLAGLADVKVSGRYTFRISVLRREVKMLGWYGHNVCHNGMVIMSAIITWPLIST